MTFLGLSQTFLSVVFVGFFSFAIVVFTLSQQDSYAGVCSPHIVGYHETPCAGDRVFARFGDAGRFCS